MPTVQVPSGGGAPASGLPLAPLQVADATLIGTDWWTQASDVITATIPVPAGAVSTLGGATGIPSFLVWPLGPIVGATGNLTVADIASIHLEMTVGTFPTSSNCRVLLPFGVVLSTATDPGDIDFTTAKSRWSSVYSGSGTAGTTVALSAQANNLSPASGGSSRVAATKMGCFVNLFLRGSVYEAFSTGMVEDATSPAHENNTNGDDMTATWNAFILLGGGRAITSGSTEAPEFTLSAGAVRRTSP